MARCFLCQSSTVIQEFQTNIHKNSISFNSDQPINAHARIADLFEPQCGTASISVDRLDDSSLVEATAKGDRDAKLRSHRESRDVGFYGWLVVSATHATLMNRRHVQSPQKDNPKHVDIVLPERAANDRQERRQHAQQRASFSSWRERQHHEVDE